MISSRSRRQQDFIAFRRTGMRPSTAQSHRRQRPSTTRKTASGTYRLRRLVASKNTGFRAPMSAPIFHHRQISGMHRHHDIRYDPIPCFTVRPGTSRRALHRDGNRKPVKFTPLHKNDRLPDGGKATWSCQPIVQPGRSRQTAQTFCLSRLFRHPGAFRNTVCDASAFGHRNDDHPAGRRSRV